MKDLMSKFEYIVVLKEKIVPFIKTLFMGGHSWGVIQKNLMSLGVRKKMSQVRKIPPPPPHDFINERSLIQQKITEKVGLYTNNT